MTRPPRRPAGWMTASKVVPLRALVARVARLRRAPGRHSVVLANGLFDLLHPGHVRYLEGARRLGDMLVVAVNDDRSARRLRGPGRPVVPARDRARIIAALRCVTAVTRFGGSTVAAVLREVRPDIHCKGTDYTPETVPERDLVRSWGGRVAIAGDDKRHATSDLIARLARRPRRAGAARRQR